MNSLAKPLFVLAAVGALSAPAFAKGDWVEPTLEEVKAKKSEMLSHRPDIVACIQAAGSVEKVYVCIEAGFADVKHKKK